MKDIPNYVKKEIIGICISHSIIWTYWMQKKLNYSTSRVVGNTSKQVRHVLFID